ncbi:MAG TPA: HDOD domain-containing protein [Bryobacteraceae bacterium]|nr:HDOD domain-containing protein [Bryobacteraceae bacterium]
MPHHPAPSEPPWALRLLPPFPAVAHRILALVNQADVSIREVGELVRMDPSFSAELLGLANSAMFSVRREVKSLSYAVMMVGLDRIKTMATLVAVNRIVRFSLRVETLRKIWIHSLVTALVAEKAAEATGLLGDSAYTAGLLHNLGTLGLMSTFPGEYAGMLEASDECGFDLLKREQDLFDIDHCLAGAYLAHDWDFPEELSAAIATHHDEPAANGRSLDNLI